MNLLSSTADRSLVLGPWSLVLGPWSLVPGPWSLVRPLQSLVRRPLIAALWLSAAAICHAQDALRYSLTGQEAARARNEALQGTDYNLKIGNARFLANASLSLEYNDNIRVSEIDPQSDLIMRPQVGTAVHWPITAKNALDFSLGLGYVKYLSHSENDYLSILPGSELAFDIFVSDFRFTLFDRFSYSQDPLQSGAVSGVGRFGGLDNAAGINAVWDLNKVIVAANYTHANFVPDQTEFEHLNRSSEFVVLRTAVMVNPTAAVGIEATGGMTTYELSFLNNALSFSAGPFAEAKLSPHLSVSARAGFVGYNFETDTDSVIGRAENPRSYYFNLRAEHVMNQYVSHSLSAGRELRLGTYSDFEEIYTAQYAIQWRIIRDVGLSTAFFYENGQYPPVLVNLPGIPQISVFGESYDRYGVTVSLGYRLMQKLSTSLSYRLTLKDSADQFRDYTQNAIVLGLNYQF